MKAEDRKTQSMYGAMWTKMNGALRQDSSHYLKMQGVIKEPIVRGYRGIEIGSGSGLDSFVMANKNSKTKIISLELSDGIFEAKKLVYHLKNVECIKGSTLSLPFRDSVFDFAYSFGVLHHVSDPKKGLLEIARVLKQGAFIALYLYEDHSENRIKNILLRLVSIFRKITAKFNPKVLIFLSRLFSPIIVVIFSWPSYFMRKFRITKNLAGSMPFNFGEGPFSLSADLYDRFGAPIEIRFSREDVNRIMDKCGFVNVCISRIDNTAGWVVWALKN